MQEHVKRLLKDIQQRPGVYLGKKSLDRLVHTLSGYTLCMLEHGEIQTAEFLPGFQEFVAERYNIQSVHHWSQIIEFFSTTEEEAFDTFFELLSEYYGTWNR